MKTPVFILRCAVGVILLSGLAAGAEPEWVQLKATVHYERTGTIATAAEGSFTYVLDATIDQVMARYRRQEDPDKYFSYSLPSEYTRSFRSKGTTSLRGEVTQKDKTSGKTYTASMNLHRVIGTEADLQLEEVVCGAPLGDGYKATLKASAKLAGTINSTYPLLPNLTKADTVMLWPTPVHHDAELGFVSDGEIALYPVLGPRPKDENEAMLYDVIAGTDEAPGLGGLRPPAVGAVTTDLGGTWTLSLNKQVKHKVLESGEGHYTDVIKVTITPVPLTLPLPKEQ